MNRKNDFGAFLAPFCCYYDHGAKISEKVQKIATTDQKEYGKCS